MVKRILKKYSSSKQAENAEIEYWQKASPEERIQALLSIQELMLNIFYTDVKGIEKIVRKRKLYDEEQD